MDMDDDWSQMGLKVGARMNIAPKVELSIQSFGFQFWGETECDACAEGGYGLRDLIIGARYALDPELYFFLDFNLPIGRERNDGTTPPSQGEIFLYFGAQHNKAIDAMKGASYGTEAGIFWGFEHHDLERGLELHLGAEFDYKLPSAPLTLLVGTQFWLRIFESEDHDKDLRDDWSDQWKFWFGANFEVLNTGTIRIANGNNVVFTMVKIRNKYGFLLSLNSRNFAKQVTHFIFGSFFISFFNGKPIRNVTIRISVLYSYCF